MDTHGTLTKVEAEHGNEAAEGGERFEKDELAFFVEDDRNAGANIGKLLAFVFFISLILVSIVCTWMVRNPAPGDDPQAGIGVQEDAHH